MSGNMLQEQSQMLSSCISNIPTSPMIENSKVSPQQQNFQELFYNENKYIVYGLGDQRSGHINENNQSSYHRSVSSRRPQTSCTNKVTELSIMDGDERRNKLAHLRKEAQINSDKKKNVQLRNQASIEKYLAVQKRVNQEKYLHMRPQSSFPKVNRGYEGIKKRVFTKKDKEMAIIGGQSELLEINQTDNKVVKDENLEKQNGEGPNNKSPTLQTPQAALLKEITSKKSHHRLSRNSFRSVNSNSFNEQPSPSNHSSLKGSQTQIQDQSSLSVSKIKSKNPFPLRKSICVTDFQRGNTSSSLSSFASQKNNGFNGSGHCSTKRKRGKKEPEIKQKGLRVQQEPEPTEEQILLDLMCLYDPLYGLSGIGDKFEGKRPPSQKYESVGSSISGFKSASGFDFSKKSQGMVIGQLPQKLYLEDLNQQTEGSRKKTFIDTKVLSLERQLQQKEQIIRVNQAALQKMRQSLQISEADADQEIKMQTVNQCLSPSASMPSPPSSKQHLEQKKKNLLRRLSQIDEKDEEDLLLESRGFGRERKTEENSNMGIQPHIDSEVENRLKSQINELEQQLAKRSDQKGAVKVNNREKHTKFGKNKGRSYLDKNSVLSYGESGRSSRVQTEPISTAQNWFLNNKKILKRAGIVDCLKGDYYRQTVDIFWSLVNQKPNFFSQDDEKGHTQQTHLESGCQNQSNIEKQTALLSRSSNRQQSFKYIHTLSPHSSQSHKNQRAANDDSTMSRIEGGKQNGEMIFCDQEFPHSEIECTSSVADSVVAKTSSPEIAHWIYFKPSPESAIFPSTSSQRHKQRVSSSTEHYIMSQEYLGCSSSVAATASSPSKTIPLIKVLNLLLKVNQNFISQLIEPTIANVFSVWLNFHNRFEPIYVDGYLPFDGRLNNLYGWCDDDEYLWVGILFKAIVKGCYSGRFNTTDQNILQRQSQQTKQNGSQINSEQKGKQFDYNQLQKIGLNDAYKMITGLRFDQLMTMDSVCNDGSDGNMEKVRTEFKNTIRTIRMAQDSYGQMPPIDHKSIERLYKMFLRSIDRIQKKRNGQIVVLQRSPRLSFEGKCQTDSRQNDIQETFYVLKSINPTGEDGYRMKLIECSPRAHKLNISLLEFLSELFSTGSQRSDSSSRFQLICIPVSVSNSYDNAHSSFRQEFSLFSSMKPSTAPTGSRGGAFYHISEQYETTAVISSPNSSHQESSLSLGGEIVNFDLKVPQNGTRVIISTQQFTHSDEKFKTIKMSSKAKIFHRQRRRILLYEIMEGQNNKKDRSYHPNSSFKNKIEHQLSQYEHQQRPQQEMILRYISDPTPTADQNYAKSNKKSLQSNQLESYSDYRGSQCSLTVHNIKRGVYKIFIECGEICLEDYFTQRNFQQREDFDYSSHMTSTGAKLVREEVNILSLSSDCAAVKLKKGKSLRRGDIELDRDGFSKSGELVNKTSEKRPQRNDNHRYNQSPNRLNSHSRQYLLDAMEES